MRYVSVRQDRRQIVGGALELFSGVSNGVAIAVSNDLEIVEHSHGEFARDRCVDDPGIRFNRTTDLHH